MSAGARLVAFGGVLAMLFVGGVLAGGASGIDRPSRASDDHGGGEHGGEHPVRGVAVAENGLRLALEDPELSAGAARTVRFRVLDEDGTTVRDFDVQHTRRMHVIVARRDLTGFQHLHPTQAPDGSWSLPLRLTDPGSYRLFADFAHDDEKSTLATDLRVDGDTDLRPLPAASPRAISDGGYDVRLEGGVAGAGEEAELRFEISRDGRPVRPETYLGAGGHLVALREGDLAFLHVHPTDDRAAEFEATFPTAGRYRLFLQFKHERRIHTVAFTKEVRES